MVIGTTFGATSELDTFFAAFRIPDLIFQLVAAGALASALIPVLAGLLATGGESRAWRVASTVTNLMLIGLARPRGGRVRGGAGDRAARSRPGSTRPSWTRPSS